MPLPLLLLGAPSTATAVAAAAATASAAAFCLFMVHDSVEFQRTPWVSNSAMLSDTDDQPHASVTTADLPDGLTVRFLKRSGNPLTCKLCGSKSNTLSPLSGAHAMDKFGGMRPWDRYTHDFKLAVKIAYGNRCKICVLSFYAGGLL